LLASDLIRSQQKEAQLPKLAVRVNETILTGDNEMISTFDPVMPEHINRVEKSQKHLARMLH
jgi:hypothetical protein